ncbi:hypothetical protein Droror1_Dr00019904, partial [Drosera rotundifolia]
CSPKTLPATSSYFQQTCGRLLPISEFISYGYVHSHSRVEASDMSVLEAAISFDAEHIKLEKQIEILASQ